MWTLSKVAGKTGFTPLTYPPKGVKGSVLGVPRPGSGSTATPPVVERVRKKSRMEGAEVCATVCVAPRKRRPKLRHFFSALKSRGLSPLSSFLRLGGTVVPVRRRCGLWSLRRVSGAQSSGRDCVSLLPEEVQKDKFVKTPDGAHAESESTHQSEHSMNPCGDRSQTNFSTGTPGGERESCRHDVVSARPEGRA